MVGKETVVALADLEGVEVVVEEGGATLSRTLGQPCQPASVD